MFTEKPLQKQYNEGTHRIAHPEETFERIRPFFPVFGITRVANITGLDNLGIPVVMVTRPNSRCLSVSQGKGQSLMAAKVSGIMESIESFHGENLDLSTRLLSTNDMRANYNLVDTGSISRNRNKKLADYSKIPWVLGQNLMDGKDTWVPYEIVHTDSTSLSAFDSGYFISDSNGLSSGNNRNEAIVHGLCEVIERDAMTLWRLEHVSARNFKRINLESIRDKKCLGIINIFQENKIYIAVWNITSDVGIPAYLCKILQDDAYDEKVKSALGAGCHPNKNVALSRALTEAAQSRLTFISGARDDQLKSLYSHLKLQGNYEGWKEEITRAGQYQDFEEGASFDNGYVEEDLELILTKLRSAGINQAICVNLTREEFDIPVVKVIVPKLECHTFPELRILGSRALNIVKARELEYV